MSTVKFKYFFSYARNDTEFVLKLAKELRAKGGNLWVDQLDILGGQHWDQAVEQALKSCQGMLAVLSPESVGSNNVMDEVSYALEEGKQVVPILLRSCDIPFRLRRVQYIDFTSDYDTGFSQLRKALRLEQPSQPVEPTAPEEPVVPDDSESPKETTIQTATIDQQAATAVSCPSFVKAFGLHLLLGFGLFYIDIRLKRRWLYVALPLYAIIDLILGPGLRIQPFKGGFGSVTFVLSLSLYALSFIDVGVSCHRRRIVNRTP